MEMGLLRPRLRSCVNAGTSSFGNRVLKHHRRTEWGSVRVRDVNPRHRSASADAPPDILLVEPDPDTRDFLCDVLERRGFRVRCVQSAAEALRAADDRPPPVVLLEVRLGEISGYEVCRALREAHGTSVLIILMSSDRTEPLDRAAGLLIGADDYLTKPISADELLARVRALLRRRAAAEEAHRTATDQRGALTARELEVLRLLADGLGQDAIAQELVITPKTVGKHIEHILLKLAVRSRAEAVAVAHQRGLDAPPNARR